MTVAEHAARARIERLMSRIGGSRPVSQQLCFPFSFPFSFLSLFLFLIFKFEFEFYYEFHH
jgi:hypothetical protein